LVEGTRRASRELWGEATAEWNASQYLKFEDERTRPSRDLLAQVPLSEVRRFADLGCGPGNSTELITARYPKARALGVDNDPDMLKHARSACPASRSRMPMSAPGILPASSI